MKKIIAITTLVAATSASAFFGNSNNNGFGNSNGMSNWGPFDGASNMGPALSLIIQQLYKKSIILLYFQLNQIRNPHSKAFNR